MNLTIDKPYPMTQQATIATDHLLKDIAVVIQRHIKVHANDNFLTIKIGRINSCHIFDIWFLFSECKFSDLTPIT